jgi:hypothetical protein
VIALSGDGNRGRVVRTLLVGDEPRDIVFGGAGKNRAFITTAHRGQNGAFSRTLDDGSGSSSRDATDRLPRAEGLPLTGRSAVE